MDLPRLSNTDVFHFASHRMLVYLVSPGLLQGWSWRMMITFPKNDEGFLEVYKVVTLELEIGFYLKRENLVWKARLIFCYADMIFLQLTWR